MPKRIKVSGLEVDDSFTCCSYTKQAIKLLSGKCSRSPSQATKTVPASKPKGQCAGNSTNTMMFGITRIKSENQNLKWVNRQVT